MPGTVDKIIQFRSSRLREAAQISIEGEPRYRKLRVENSLTDEHGDEVKLEKGAHVEVTVTAEGKRKLIESSECEHGTAQGRPFHLVGSRAALRRQEELPRHRIAAASRKLFLLTQS